jgi:branched-chain amino acid transport system permease protein
MITQIVYNILFSTAIYIVISFSFSLIYYAAKFFNITHAVIVTFGAYFSYLFYKQVSLPIWLVIPLAVLLSVLLGLLLEIIIYKPLRKRKTTPLLLLITSLGLYVAFQNFISLIWGDETKSLRTSDVNVGNEILGAFITNTQIIIIFVCIGLLLLTLLFLKFTKTGKNIRAVSSNSELANIFGINSDMVILWSFVIGSSLGSIVGILVAFDSDMTPTMGFNLLLYGIVAMIIGGVGSIRGLIVGALLLGTAQHLTAFYIDSKWMDAIAYVILILFLIWKPLGFSGKRLKKIEI